LVVQHPLDSLGDSVQTLFSFLVLGFKSSDGRRRDSTAKPDPRPTRRKGTFSALECAFRVRGKISAE
jgi:hypothetical protein